MLNSVTAQLMSIIKYQPYKEWYQKLTILLHLPMQNMCAIFALK